MSTRKIINLSVLSVLVILFLALLLPKCGTDPEEDLLKQIGKKSSSYNTSITNGLNTYQSNSRRAAQLFNGHIENIETKINSLSLQYKECEYSFQQALSYWNSSTQEITGITSEEEVTGYERLYNQIENFNENILTSEKQQAVANIKTALADFTHLHKSLCAGDNNQGSQTYTTTKQSIQNFHQFLADKLKIANVERFKKAILNIGKWNTWNLKQANILIKQEQLRSNYFGGKSVAESEQSQFILHIQDLQKRLNSINAFDIGKIPSIEQVKLAYKNRIDANSKALKEARMVTLANANLSFDVTDGLDQSLLLPLITSWYKSSHGLGWIDGIHEPPIITDECVTILIAKNIEELQAARKNPDAAQRLLKVYIRKIPVQDNRIFDRLFTPDTDLLITGRELPTRILERWLSSLPDKPQKLTRNLRKRLCSDALVFMRLGSDTALSGKQILDYSKVFYPDHSLVREACNILDFAPITSSGDIVLDDNQSTWTDRKLIEEYPTKLVLTSFHKSQSEYNESYKLPNPVKTKGKWRRPEGASCQPNAFTINTADYPYSYRINLYHTRSYVETNRKHAINFAHFATILDGEAQKLIQKLNYVPLSPQNDNQFSILTSEHLPVEEVVRILCESGRNMGYTMGDRNAGIPTSSKLRGIKLSYPIHFDTDKDDPKVTSYNEDDIYSMEDIGKVVEKLLEDDPVAIIIVGHADEQGGDYDYNAGLSNRRALSALREIIAPKLSHYISTEQAKHMKDRIPFLDSQGNITIATLGCSFDRPIAERPSRNASKAAISRAYAKDRRVEIFVIWPND